MKKNSPQKGKKTTKPVTKVVEEEPSNTLPEEVISLVNLASGKDIDIAVWLTEDGKTIDSVDFVNKMKSLALVTGLDQDAITKTIVDAATSEKSVRTIVRLCGSGSGTSSNPNHIDISQFLKLCASSDYKSAPSVDLQDAAELHNLGIETTTFTAGEKGGSMVDRFSTMYFDELKDTNQQYRSSSIPETTTTVGTTVTSSSSSDMIVDDESSSSPHVTKKTPNTSSSPTRKGTSSITPKSRTVTTTSTTTPKGSVTSSSSSHNNNNNNNNNKPNKVYNSSSARSSSANPSRPSTAPVTSTNRTRPTTSRLSTDSVSSSTALTTTTTRPRQGTSPSRLVGTRLVRTSTTPSTASLFVDLQARESAPFVEDSIRTAVRQADLYHVIQVHLGFVSEGYTMVPARGIIVASRPREWLSVHDIQTAFQAGRVRLSETQVIAMGQLVNTFATEYKTNHGNIPVASIMETSALVPSDEAKEEPINTTQSRFAPLNVTPLPSAALSPQGHKINAEWLRMYLVNLRLSAAPRGTRRSLAASSEKALVASTTSLSAGGGSGDHDNKQNAGGTDGHDVGTASKPLMPWLDWLGSKLAGDQKDAAGKSRGFRKALAGKPHPLTKDEMNGLLETHDVVPTTTMEEEIGYRVRCWVLDTSGRRDFFFAVERKMREWEVKHKADAKAAQMMDLPPGASYKPVKITDGEREEARTTIRQECIAEKTTELRTSEQTNATITKDLYWKYDAILRENNYSQTQTWGDWLKQHREESEKQLNKFQKLERLRARAVADRVSRKYLVASLDDIEVKLLKLLEQSNLSSLKSFAEELKKSLVALRKCAMDRAEGSVTGGAVISKQEFDFHLEAVLAPRLKDLPDVVRVLAKDIHRSYQELLEQHGLTEPTTITSWESKGGGEEGNDGGLFKVDREAVEKRILAQRDQKFAESKEKFDVWINKKVEEKKASLAAAQAKTRQKKQETKEKKDKAEKAYKKWLKLQKKNTYVSKIDGKKRKIPDVKTCEHPVTWSKETDLADYHVENDRRFY